MKYMEGEATDDFYEVVVTVCDGKVNVATGAKKPVCCETLVHCSHDLKLMPPHGNGIGESHIETYSSKGKS